MKKGLVSLALLACLAGGCSIENPQRVPETKPEPRPSIVEKRDRIEFKLEGGVLDYTIETVQPFRKAYLSYTEDGEKHLVDLSRKDFNPLCDILGITSGIRVSKKVLEGSLLIYFKGRDEPDEYRIRDYLKNGEN